MGLLVKGMAGCPFVWWAVRLSELGRRYETRPANLPAIDFAISDVLDDECTATRCNLIHIWFKVGWAAEKAAAEKAPG